MSPSAQLIAPPRVASVPRMDGVGAAAHTPTPAADAESARWLEDLRAEGPERDRAVERLHALLLRAARFEVGRRRAGAPHLRDDLDDVAAQAADDALLAVLRKLDGFRGESRFTTWAYKFALLEAAVRVRRLEWQGRELPREPESWELVVAAGPSPASQAETGELLRAVREAIDSDLTRHQREVLVALALNGVPIDVLADRLGTTRGALYKTLHDARRKLRARLAKRGFTIGEGGPG
jgi:RNA polymerase sigma-70 factor, ECF subfamily